MFIAARLFGQAAIDFPSVSSQRDDQKIGTFGSALASTRQFKAVHFGQTDIQKSDLRLESAQHLERNAVKRDTSQNELRAMQARAVPAFLDSVERFRNFQRYSNFSREVIPKLLEIVALLAPVPDCLE